MSERAHGFESHPLRLSTQTIPTPVTEVLIQFYIIILFGEVPKLAEGTPLERVQVVNSGARVQIPPSPLIGCRFITYCRMETERQKKDKKVLTKHERHDKMYIALLMTE